MYNYTLWILVFNRKVWKTALFSTRPSEIASKSVENPVETVKTSDKNEFRTF